MSREDRQEARCDWNKPEAAEDGRCVESRAPHGLQEVGEVSGQRSGCKVSSSLVFFPEDHRKHWRVLSPRVT